MVVAGTDELPGGAYREQADVRFRSLVSFVNAAQNGEGDLLLLAPYGRIVVGHQCPAIPPAPE